MINDALSSGLNGFVGESRELTFPNGSVAKVALAVFGGIATGLLVRKVLQRIPVAPVSPARRSTESDLSDAVNRSLNRFYGALPATLFHPLRGS